MSSTTLCSWVRFSAVAFACYGALLLAVLVWEAAGVLLPEYGQQAAYLWCGFLILAAVPCFAVLVLVWRVSTAIKNDAVFTVAAARTIGAATTWLCADAAFIFAGTVVLTAMNINHPGPMLAALLAVLALTAFGLLAAVLSRYIARAADLQEVSEGTI